jgi:hypothetical protein
VALSGALESSGNTHLSSKEDESARPAKRQRLLPFHDLSLLPSQDGVGSDSDHYSGDELNTNFELDEDDRRSRPAHRKQPSSSCDGLTQSKRKHHFQRRPRSKSHRHHPKPQSPFDQGSRAATGYSAKGRLPSPAPSTLQSIDTKMPPNCCNLSGSSRNILPTLTEITFRPHSL